MTTTDHDTPFVYVTKHPSGTVHLTTDRRIATNAQPTTLCAEYAWPDPLSVGWASAWKQVADQLAEVLEGLLIHFSEDQARAARAVLEVYEDFTSYDECHGTGAELAALDDEVGS